MRRAREREGERSEPGAAASGGRRERNRASAHIFFSQGSHLAAAFWKRRALEERDRAGKGRRQDARRRRWGDTGGARRYCWWQSFVSLGGCSEREGSWSPQPAAALRPAPNPGLPAGVAAYRRHPSRALRSWLELQICMLWGFSTLVEGIGLRRRNFFLSFFFFLALIWLCWGSPPLSSTVLATVVLAEGRGLRWRS